MKKLLISLLILSLGFLIGYFMANQKSKTDTPISEMETVHSDSSSMNLGAFSISLNVENLERSKAFYEQLGFSVFVGSMEEDYLIMKSNQIVIGLFMACLNPTL